MRGPRAARLALALLCTLAPLVAASEDAPAPPGPPTAPIDRDPYFFTTAVFYNVGPCTTIQAVKFTFVDEAAPGSGRETLCPTEFRRLGGGHCDVPGPYSVPVKVVFNGIVRQLDITLLNPSDDDANITNPMRVYLRDSRSSQLRNTISSSMDPDSPLVDDGETTFCSFRVASMDDPSETGDIDDGKFRVIFKHFAHGVGTAQPYSNGDNLLGNLVPAQTMQIDHRLMGCCDGLDRPLGAIGVSFVTQLAGTVQLTDDARQAPWLAGSNCERSSITFVLYGAPDANQLLRVLRIDGAGDLECAYGAAERGQFDAEVAAYNAAAEGARVVLGFGLSLFQPFASLVLSPPLGYQGTASFAAVKQASDLYVTLFDAGGPTGGAVLLYPQTRSLHPQKRNLLGVSTRIAGAALQIDGSYSSLEIRALEEAAAPIATDHFRVLFVHLAADLPAMHVYANDDVFLATVQPGAVAALDHVRVAPHAAGKIVKLQFLSDDGATTAAQSFDLSTRCDLSAYALIFAGTIVRTDEYDPLVFGVAGAAQQCVLSSGPTAAGASTKLLMLNGAPSAAVLPMFQWGASLLTLSFDSGAMPASGGASLIDLPTGTTYIRLVGRDPPYAPLTTPLALPLLSQSLNVVMAVADGAVGVSYETTSSQVDSGETGEEGEALMETVETTTATTAFTPSGWRIVAPQQGATAVGAGQLRLLVVNALATDSATFDVGGTSVTLPPRAATVHTTDVAASSGATVSVASGGGDAAASAAPAVSLSVTVPTSACAQSVQLVALQGISLTLATEDVSYAAFAPALQHADVSGDACHVPSVFIPPFEQPVGRPAPPPPVYANYDLTGMGAGAFEPLLSAAPPSRTAAGRSWWLGVGVAVGVAVGLEVARSRSCSRRGCV